MTKIWLILLCCFNFPVPVLSQFQEIATSFGNISAIDATENNMIYVADRRFDRIIRLDSEGNRIDSLGGTGSGMYQFDGILGFDASNGMKLFVADRYNQRIQIFDRRLQYLTSLNRTESRSGNLTFEPIAIAVDRMDQAYFFDDLSKTIFKFNFRGEFDKQIYVKKDEEIVDNVLLRIDENFLYLYQENSNNIFVYTVDGKYVKFIRLEQRVNDIIPFANGFFAITDSVLIAIDKVGTVTKSLPLPSIYEQGHLATNSGFFYYCNNRTIFRLPRNSLR